MFGISITRDEQNCATVGDLIKFLEKYPLNTPVLTGFDDEVKISKPAMASR